MKRKLMGASVVNLAAVMLASTVSVTSVAAVDNGWEVVNGNYYWYENGVKQGTEGRGKEIYDPDSDAWYWLDAVDGGKKATGKDLYQESDAGVWAEERGKGKWVRYDENGHMIKGWDINENGSYYFDPTYGTMAKGYVVIDEQLYYFDELTGIGESSDWDGVNGWVIIDGNEYWYEEGIRQGTEGRGKEIYDPGSNAWYWLDSVDNGKKAVSKDVYQESAAGEWGEGADGTGKWVRYDEFGHMIKGWSTNENGIYYFDPIYGTMAKGRCVIDGQEYVLNSVSGVCESEVVVSTATPAPMGEPVVEATIKPTAEPVTPIVSPNVNPTPEPTRTPAPTLIPGVTIYEEEREHIGSDVSDFDVDYEKLIDSFGELSNVGTISGYSPQKALNYAEGHYNDGVGKCAEFVSNCLNEGGISAWSKSCTELRRQLLNSGLGQEYELALQSDMSVKASNYTEILKPGDVVFFYCPSCVNIDGKPYVHVVLCNGMDSKGFMKAYSHNAANSGRSKYQYSSKCYFCGTKISKAFVYHFSDELGSNDAQGTIDLVSGGAGTIRVAGWAFDKDTSNPIEIHVYVGGGCASGAPGYCITADKERTDVAKAYSVGNYHGYDAELTVEARGNTDVYLYAINASGTGGNNVFLGMRTVTVNEEYKIDFNSGIYNASVGESITIPFTFKGDGIASMAYSISDDSVCNVTWGTVNWKTGNANLKISGKKVGTSTITVIFQDDNKGTLYQKSFDVAVSSKNEKVKLSQNSITLNMSDKMTEIVDLTWDCPTGAWIIPNHSNIDVVAVTYDNVTTNSMQIKYEALKLGYTTVEFTITDASNNSLGSAVMTIVVSE